MIRNLNSIAFKGFGSVLSERAQAAKRLAKEEKNLKTSPGRMSVSIRPRATFWWTSQRV